jgi:hypothetical protein
MFEKPQKAQVVRIKIEAVSLDSTSMAPSFDGPLLAGQRPSSPAAATSPRDYTSVCSAISSASSTSIPRYLTVLSSFVCQSRS